jgi:23S rRNA (guanosine2251-2'-O)-methyltransferase
MPRPVRNTKSKTGSRDKFKQGGKDKFKAGAREKGNTGTRERSGAGARDRSAAGTRERSAAGARERSAAGARENAVARKSDDAIRETNIQEKSEQLEGRHPVIEALKSGRELNKILLSEGVEGGSANEILSRARDAGIIVQRVPKDKLDSIAVTRNHQGVVAYLAAKEYIDLDVILEEANRSPRPGLIVVLDEIEDPFNLGSVLRSANGAGAHGVVIPKRRAVALTATVAKASAGAIEHIPVARVTNISQTLDNLKKAGYWIVGTDVDSPELYYQADLTGPIVLVIGNEGKGLGEAVKKRCDFLVRLPMIGKVQSLNAGVAAGILLYDVIRQRGIKK